MLSGHTMETTLFCSSLLRIISWPKDFFSCVSGGAARRKGSKRELHLSTTMYRKTIGISSLSITELLSRLEKARLARPVSMMATCVVRNFPKVATVKPSLWDILWRDDLGKYYKQHALGESWGTLDHGRSWESLQERWPLTFWNGETSSIH